MVVEKEEQVDNLDALEEPYAFLTGKAGSGKTFTIKAKAAENPNYIKLGATTGIAAVNLDEKTIHSTLKYFDHKSLETAWREQFLHWNLRKVRSRGYHVLGIEECSMMGAEDFDLIMSALDDINNDKTGKQLGLHIIGDLCQLPPIKQKFIFESPYWERFENNTIKLEKIWRQDNPKFVEAINLVRADKGEEAMPLFKECGVTFANELNWITDATTLIPNNFDVDSYNEKRLNALSGSLIRTVKRYFGKQLPEWTKHIPYELRVKKGAYVMILINDVPEFNYVNGDCGHIEDYDERDDIFYISLVRTGQTVKIGRTVRYNLTDKQPDQSYHTTNFTPTSDYKTGDWIIGKILFHPIRLAYASTIHKSQGLSLDKVQIDTRPQFFTADAMGYVSISRCRTPEGLVLVGKPDNIGKKMRMNKKVLKYA